MKRLFTLLLAALMLLPLFSALAEPRYPESQGSVTDAAAVLSTSTVQDLRKLADAFSDAGTMDLYVATVDFLDGATLSNYAEGLREKWWLEEDDLLLLMVVGEDKFGFFGGADVNKHLSVATQQKLLSTIFNTPFLQQDYNGAVAALMPALATEAGKAWNENIDISGLFGTVNAASLATEQDWLVRPVDRMERTADHITDYDHDSGFSLGKVILTVFLLLIIFGNRGKNRHARNGCGCGCMPFSSLLAGWGLWKLWKK